MRNLEDLPFAARIRQELEDELALPPTADARQGNRATTRGTNGSPAPTFCPACAATLAILATKQVEIVDLEARLERTSAARDNLRAKVSELRGSLSASRKEIAALRAELADHERQADRMLSELRDAGLIDDDEDGDDEPQDDEEEE